MSFGVVEGESEAGPQGLTIAEIEGHPFGQIQFSGARWALRLSHLGLVVDRPLRGASEQLGVLAQQLRAHRMKRRRAHPAGQLNPPSISLKRSRSSPAARTLKVTARISHGSASRSASSHAIR